MLNELCRNQKYREGIEVKVIDLLKYSDVQKLCIDIFKNKKRIDLLVNNAGIPHGSLFMTTSINDLTDVISANFMSHINISQICARLMMKRSKGKIINISSISAARADAGTLAYGTSKAALEYATKVMARELGSYGIMVNAISPGITKPR